MKFNKITALFFIIILVTSPLLAQEKIYIGSIYSRHMEKKIDKFAILTNYLNSQISKDVVFHIKLEKKTSRIIQLFNDKQLDIFIDSIYATSEIKKNSDIDILSNNWKNGKRGYKSVIFVNAKSSINNLSGLKNKTIAFEDEFSSSGYFIPRKELEKHGFIFDAKNEKRNIKYIFSKSEQNSAAKVLFGQVEAGTTDDYSFSNFEKGLFKIIHKSEFLPRSLISFSKGMDESLRSEILNILYSMHKSEEGRKVLKEFSNSTKITPISNFDKKVLDNEY